MNLQAAEQHLQQDPAFRELIATVGPCTLQPDTSFTPLQALVRSVCYQQLHVKAGDKIFARLLAALPQHDYSARDVLAADVSELRAAGLSQRKVECVYALANAELTGIVPSRAQAARLSDAQLVQQISQVKGIGPWTVQMWLMFHEGREDIWPVLDFGVREGWKRLYQLDSQPSAKTLQPLADHLSPYRSIAAWYLWRVPKQ